MKQLINSFKSFIETHFFDNFFFNRKLENLFQVVGGHIYFQTLASAVQLNLFDVLASRHGMTQNEIAAEIKIKEQPCRILLLGLTSIKLIKKKGDKYYNSKISEIYFLTSSPKSLRNTVLWQHFINYKAMFHFYESLKSNSNIGLSEFKGTGTTLYERLAFNPELENIFQLAMEEISRQANKQLLEHLDLSDTKFAVDIGGGTGENIIKLVQANQHLKGGVFDSPTVAVLARENFQKHELHKRLTAFEGNCFHDPLPKGPDCFIVCHFLTIWSLEKDHLLIKNIFDSLPSKGKIVIFNMMQDNDRTGPLTSSMGSPYFLTLATGEGMLYTWDEYLAILRKVGFRKIDVKKLPMDHGLIVGTKD